MSMEPLVIEKLDGGRALERVNEAIGSIVRDVIKRPYVETARTVTLKISIVPHVVGEQGFVNLAPEIEYEVGTKSPPYSGNRTVGAVKQDPLGKDQLLINVDLPGAEPGQSTIFDGQRVDTNTGEVIDLKRKNGEE